jgi:hypothetical protein
MDNPNQNSGQQTQNPNRKPVSRVVDGQSPDSGRAGSQSPASGSSPIASSGWS